LLNSSIKNHTGQQRKGRGWWETKPKTPKWVEKGPGNGPLKPWAHAPSYLLTGRRVYWCREKKTIEQGGRVSESNKGEKQIRSPL